MFSQFFFSIFEIYTQYWTFSKKRWPSSLIYFWTYGLQKTWLDKCLKSAVSDDPSTTNMVNGLKLCWNLNGSTFTIFIDHCDGNSFRKNFSWWYGKSQDCLLTDWLPMTSILLLIETIYCNIFRCNYLRNKKLFLDFFSHFQNLNSILKIKRKKMTLIADWLLILRNPKNLVR